MFALWYNSIMIIDFHEMPLTATEKEKFGVFCDFLLESNKKFNITAITDRDGVYQKHFADSLVGKDYFLPNSSVLEIGSGGGFPSVPLKICRPDLKFTLAESNGKKCGFLKEVAALLKFDNFDVLNARAEELPEEYKGKFDFVTARAVAGSSTLCELTLPYLKIGGKAVFYKNRSDEEIKAAERAAKKLGCELSEVIDYELNGADGTRCVLVIKKKRATDSAYPRVYNKILKKPL